jgi:cephalosporin hydroxylase
LAARRTICLIVFSIDGGGSAVFFANRVSVCRVTEPFDVRGASLWQKDGGRRSPFREGLIDDRVGGFCEDALRERRGLRKQ